ncbi:MAG: transketolase [Alphaproteobacteria bacterium]
MNIFEQRARNIRKNIILSSAGGITSHFGGSLSGVEVLTYIYSIMNIKNNEDRDRFILSKGHCALLLYSTLCEFGYITKDELRTFDQNGSYFSAHCVLNRKAGIELTSGSLGMGLSFALGQALALKRKNLDNKIYVLVGNGEANEGAFWEAVMFAGAKKINNIVLILDNNGMQLDGFSKDILPITSWFSKFVAFGWNSVEINGHDFNEIDKAFRMLSEKPLAIIANTIKGKGISFMENNPDWHHSSLSEEEYNQALKELEEC